MELIAKLIEKKDIQTGQGKNGEWRKQEIIVETNGEYPKKICLTIWGDRINVEELVIGQEMIYHIDIESREYNSKWYTDVKAWKIEAKSNSVSAGLMGLTIEEHDRIEEKSKNFLKNFPNDPF